MMMKRPKGEWTDLFRTFRMSLDPRKLWLAFRGIIVSLVLLGLVLAALAILFHARGMRFDVGPAPSRAGQGAPTAAAAAATQPKEDDDFVLAPTDVLGALWHSGFAGGVRATTAFTTCLFRDAALDALGPPGPGATPPPSPVSRLLNSEKLAAALVTSLVMAFVLLLVWSYYGAAIMRVAAVEYALGERIELKSATAYARRKHHSFYGAPLGIALAIVAIALGVAVVGLIGWNILVVCLGGAGVLAAGIAGSRVHDSTRSTAGAACVVVGMLVVTGAVCAWVAGAEWRVPWLGEIAAGLLSPLAFVGGLVMVLLAVWLAFGAALMAGALSSSDSDTFDAWSRSFHYLFVHPWRYAWYVAVALAHAAACLAFVWVVRVAVEWATLWPLAVGLLGRFELAYHYMTGGGDAGAGTGAACLLGFFLTADRLLLDLLFLSFVVSYSATAKTIVYFLMRRCSDGTPITEVHLEPRDRDVVYPAPAADKG